MCLTVCTFVCLMLLFPLCEDEFQTNKCEDEHPSKCKNLVYASVSCVFWNFQSLHHILEANTNTLTSLHVYNFGNQLLYRLPKQHI